MNNLERIAKLKKRETKLEKVLERLEATTTFSIQKVEYKALILINRTPVRIRVQELFKDTYDKCEFTVTENTLVLVEVIGIPEPRQKQIFKAVSKWLTSPTRSKK